MQGTFYLPRLSILIKSWVALSSFKLHSGSMLAAVADDLRPPSTEVPAVTRTVTSWYGIAGIP